MTLHIQGISIHGVGAWGGVLVNARGKRHDYSGASADGSATRMALTAAVTVLGTLPPGSRVTIRLRDRRLVPCVNGCVASPDWHLTLQRPELWRRIMALSATHLLDWRVTTSRDVWIQRAEALARTAHPLSLYHAKEPRPRGLNRRAA